MQYFEGPAATTPSGYKTMGGLRDDGGACVRPTLSRSGLPRPSDNLTPRFHNRGGLDKSPRRQLRVILFKSVGDRQFPLRAANIAKTACHEESRDRSANDA
jgi:hypothetical protein